MLISKKVIGLIIPDWDHCANRVKIGDATPLEKFIHDNEPAGHVDAEKFRIGLLAVLESSK